MADQQESERTSFQLSALKDEWLVEAKKLLGLSKQYWEDFLAKHEKDPVQIWASHLYEGRGNEDDERHLTLLELVDRGKQVLNLMVTTESTMIKRMSKAELLDPTEKKFFEKEDIDMSNVQLAFTASPAADAITGLYKQKKSGIDRGHPQLLWEAMASFCEEHSNYMVMMINRPIFLHVAQDRVRLGGIAVLIDVIPPLDPSLRMKVLQFGFMGQLANHTMEKHQTPQGRDKLCMLLYAGFKAFKQKHLNCKTCCPSPESRARARELYDSSTATILPNACCGTDRYDKIIHANLFWPDCLPEHCRNGTFDWLGDPAERVRVMKEIVGEPAARLDSSDSETISDCIDILDLNDLQHIVTGGDQADPKYNMLKEEYNMLREDIEGLAPDEFAFTVRYGCEDRDRVHLILQKEKFQRPAIIMEESGRDATYSVKIDLKKCAYCDKEEEVSRTHGQCNRCKSVYYCCREHQVNDWPHHKQSCTK